MKRLSLLVLIFIIGCSDPMNEFVPIAKEELDLPPELVTQHKSLKKSLSSDNLKRELPEFLGELKIDDNLIAAQEHGIYIGWTPLVQNQAVNGLLLTFGSKNN